MSGGGELSFRVERNHGSPISWLLKVGLNLSPIYSIASVGIVEGLEPKKHPHPASARTAVPGHPCVIDGGLAVKNSSPSMGLGGRCRQGGGWAAALSRRPPHPTGLCVRAGHQSRTDEVRGCLNYLSGVLIKNLWASCNWLKWGCRVVYGFHFNDTFCFHHDLG